MTFLSDATVTLGHVLPDLCKKLAARGQLVFTFGGYSLSEFSGSGSRPYPAAFGGGLYGGSGQLY